MDQQNQTLPISTNPEPKEVKKRHRWLLWTMVSILIVVTGIVGLGASGVYWLRWQNWYTYDVSRIVPLPVASFNSQKIYYKDYYQVARGLQAQQASTKTGKSLDHAVDQQAIGLMVELDFLYNYSKSHDITLTSSEINTVVNANLRVLTLSQQKQAKLYPATLNDQAKVAVFRQKITAAQGNTAAGLANALKKATTIKNQLGNDGLIKLYASQVTQGKASGPAALPPTQAPTEVSEAFNALPPNVLSDPISASDGNVYLIENATQTDGSTKKYNLIIPGNPSFNFESWLNQQLAHYPEAIYLPQLNLTTSHA